MLIVLSIEELICKFSWKSDMFVSVRWHMVTKIHGRVLRTSFVYLLYIGLNCVLFSITICEVVSGICDIYYGHWAKKVVLQACLATWRHLPYINMIINLTKREITITTGVHKNLKMKCLMNYDSKASLGKKMCQSAHCWESLNNTHGILNVVGLGAFVSISK